MEKIILAPQISETEFLRTLAKYGNNTFGLRILNDIGLAKYVCERYGFMNSAIQVMDKKKSISLIYKIIKSKQYFKYCVYDDAVNVYNSICQLRNSIVIDDCEEPLVEELECINDFLCNNDTYKNITLYNIYRDYYSTKFEGDYIYFDNIDYLRAVKNFAEEGCMQIILLNEVYYSPLELDFVNKICFDTEWMDIKDLFVDKEESKEIKWYKSYGSSNEIENALNIILENKYPFDECLFVTPNVHNYLKYFENAFNTYKIPFAYTPADSIYTTYPYQFLEAYNYYYYSQRGHDDFLNFINSNFFDKKKFINDIGIQDLEYKKQCDVLDKIGYLRLCNDDEENKKKLDNIFKTFDKLNNYLEGKKETYSNTDQFINDTVVGKHNDGMLFFYNEYKEAFYKASECLSLGGIEFLNRYCIIRKYCSDSSALKTILDNCDALAFWKNEINLDLLLETVKSTVLGNKESFPGSIQITDIHNALSYIRKHVFVIGMDSSYPGSPKEDYLISDDHYKTLDNELVLTSDKKILNKSKEFYDLLSLLEHLGTDLHISYPYFSLTENRALNASSLLFQYYSFEHKDASLKEFNNIFEKVDFKDGLSYSNKLAYNFNKYDEITYQKEELNHEHVNFMERYNYFSPSAIENYFRCPRMFYLKTILRFPDKEEIDNFMILDARNKGTMIHSCLEYRSLTKCKKEEVIELFNHLYEVYLSTHILFEGLDAYGKEYKDIIEALETYYDHPLYESLLSEEDIRCTHEETGIVIHGFPDNVEIIDDGIKVIDYKTGRKVKHVENDIDTCLQTIIYCYILEHSDVFKKSGLKTILGSEYRYIIKNEIVKCEYSEIIKEQLKDKLNELKNSLISGNFPQCESSKCSENYCKFINLCGREEEE